MADAPPTRKVSRSIQIYATPSRVFQAFLDAEQLKQWWGVSTALIEPRKGGVYALGWSEAGQGFDYVGCGVIKSYAPNKRLRIDSMVYFGPGHPPLGPMRLTVNLLEREDRTRVAVRQEGFGTGPVWDQYYEAVSQGWKGALKNLKTFLED